MLSASTIAVFVVTIICLILACIDFEPRYHHSQTQKRRKGKFVKRYQKPEQYRVKFVQVNTRTLRRVA